MPLGMELALDPAPPPQKKGGTAPPTFRLMSIVAKRSPSSATAELLFSYANVRRRFQECVSLAFLRMTVVTITSGAIFSQRQIKSAHRQ